MTLMPDVHTGKPDDKKEKGGDKADDKVGDNVNKTLLFYSHAATKSSSLFHQLYVSMFCYKSVVICSRICAVLSTE